MPAPGRKSLVNAHFVTKQFKRWVIRYLRPDLALSISELRERFHARNLGRITQGRARDAMRSLARKDGLVQAESRLGVKTTRWRRTRKPLPLFIGAGSGLTTTETASLLPVDIY